MPSILKTSISGLTPRTFSNLTICSFTSTPSPGLDATSNVQRSSILSGSCHFSKVGSTSEPVIQK